MRSKAALLLVLATKRAGPAAVQELLPQLLFAAKESATHTEMVGSSALLPSVIVTDQRLALGYQPPCLCSASLPVKEQRSHEQCI